MGYNSKRLTEGQMPSVVVAEKLASKMILMIHSGAFRLFCSVPAPM